MFETGCLGRQQRNIRQAARRLRNPQFGAPVQNAAIGRDRARNADQLRRAFRIPAELVLARPLHPHRTSGGTRQYRCVSRGILVAVHAVAAGALKVDHPHLFLWKSKEFGKSRLITVGPLRGGPDRRRIIAHVGNGAGRADRCVALHRPVISRGEGFCAGGTLCDGRPVPSLHCARNARDARTAFHSSSATTASRSFTRTTFAPWISLIEASSTDTSLAPTAPGLITRACSMFGTARSCT